MEGACAAAAPLPPLLSGQTDPPASARRDLLSWMQYLRIEKYHEIFVVNGITTLAKLTTLDDDILRALGLPVGKCLFTSADRPMLSVASRLR